MDITKLFFFPWIPTLILIVRLYGDCCKCRHILTPVINYNFFQNLTLSSTHLMPKKEADESKPLLKIAILNYDIENDCASFQNGMTVLKKKCCSDLILLQS